MALSCTIIVGCSAGIHIVRCPPYVIPLSLRLTVRNYCLVWLWKGVLGMVPGGLAQVYVTDNSRRLGRC